MTKSMLTPPEREQYLTGGFLKLGKAAVKKISESFEEDVTEKEIKNKLNNIIDKIENAPIGSTKKETLKRISEEEDVSLALVKEANKINNYRSGGGKADSLLEEGASVIRAMIKKPTSGQADAEFIGGGKYTREARRGKGFGFLAGAATATTPSVLATAWYMQNDEEPTTKEASDFEKAFSKAHNAGEETFMFEGKLYTTEVRKGKAEGGPTQEELSRQVQAASRAVEEAVDKGIKERQQAAKALEEATTNYLNIPKPAPTEKEQVEAVRERFGKAEGGKPAPISMFQGLSLLGVSQTNIDKMAEATGDIPVAVADAIIYLGDKAREAGLIDDPKKNKNVDEPRKNKAEGSILTPREGYAIGSLVTKIISKAVKKPASKEAYPGEAGDIRDIEEFEEILSTPNKDAIFFSKEKLNELKKEVDATDAYAEMLGEFVAIRQQDDEIIKMGESLGYSSKKIKTILEGDKKGIAKLRSDFDALSEKNLAEAENRAMRAEGSLMMPEEGMPVDTYPNIPEDEMDEALASQLPDAEMEEEYIDFVMDESLNDEEQDYLAGVLQKDPRLSDILDKVITVASEFSGAGEVDGPGTGVSDSIPARLSDGEFVFTKKATDQIGADNLQRMMDDAERAYDGGYQMKAEGGLMQNLEEPLNLGMGQTRDEIEKLMMRSNKMPSLQ